MHFLKVCLEPLRACRGMDCRLSIYGAVNWLELLLRWWVVQDLNSANLACGLNLQPACRGMDWRLSIYGVVNWLELLLRWWVVQDSNLRPID